MGWGGSIAFGRLDSIDDLIWNLKPTKSHPTSNAQQIYLGKDERLARALLQKLGQGLGRVVRVGVHYHWSRGLVLHFCVLAGRVDIG